ncbi:MAG: hypothetical protein DRP06_01600 [Candidatus Aenigmatarchaeota archaeon]|nr:MAG: hypothetical protein DRP06_01600 [Candidatus Aenigmarchaeota archaeon]
MNYTNSTTGNPINGTGVYCEWQHNKTGTWKDKINMTYNETSKLYELIADGGYLFGHRGGMPFGNYSWNVSCYNDLGYNNLTVADDLTVSLYSTTLVIENGTDNPHTNQDVWFYANYTSSSMKSGIGLNRSEIGRVVWNTTDFGTNTIFIRFADLDNDGKKDEIVTSQMTGYHDRNIFGYYSNGTQMWEYLYNIFQGNIHFLETGDLDGDGFHNNIIAGGAGDYVRVFNETGNEIWNSGDLGADVYTGRIGDFDNDGKIDDFVIFYRDISSVYHIGVWNTPDGANWHNLWNLSIDLYGRE